MSQDSELLYKKVIYDNPDKFYQLNLTVSEFREKFYVNIRKYFQSFEGDFIPSKEGISMEASISNVLSLLDGIIDIVAKEEAIELIDDYFRNKKIELQSTK